MPPQILNLVCLIIVVFGVVFHFGKKRREEMREGDIQNLKTLIGYAIAPAMSELEESSKKEFLGEKDYGDLEGNEKVQVDNKIGDKLRELRIKLNALYVKALKARIADTDIPEDSKSELGATNDSIDYIIAQCEGTGKNKRKLTGSLIEDALEDPDDEQRVAKEAGGCCSADQPCGKFVRAVTSFGLAMDEGTDEEAIKLRLFSENLRDGAIANEDDDYEMDVLEERDEVIEAFKDWAKRTLKEPPECLADTPFVAKGGYFQRIIELGKWRDDEAEWLKANPEKALRGHEERP
eukprot:SAG11_NODE_327_length_10699_cov_4.828272_10_plen_293_part_00